MDDQKMVWTKIDEKPFKGAYKTYLTRTYKMPDGSTADFDVTYCKSAMFTGCLALTKDKNVILSKEFRPGPEMVTYDQPMGEVDFGETPDEAVKRELREETGYEAKKWIAVNVDGYAAYPYGGSKGYAYIALDCEKMHEQQLGKYELIQVVVMPLKDFMNDMLRKGKVCHPEIAWAAVDYMLQNKMITLEDIAANNP